VGNDGKKNTTTRRNSAQRSKVGREKEKKNLRELVGGTVGQQSAKRRVRSRGRKQMKEKVLGKEHKKQKGETKMLEKVSQRSYRDKKEKIYVDTFLQSAP